MWRNKGGNCSHLPTWMTALAPSYNLCSVQSDSKTEEAVGGGSQCHWNPDTLVQEVPGCVPMILFCWTEDEHKPVRNSSGPMMVKPLEATGVVIQANAPRSLTHISKKMYQSESFCPLLSVTGLRCNRPSLGKPVTHQEGFKVSNHFEVCWMLKFPNSCKVNYIQTLICDYGSLTFLFFVRLPHFYCCRPGL